jgi:hypothetical protein
MFFAPKSKKVWLIDPIGEQVSAREGLHSFLNTKHP